MRLEQPRSASGATTRSSASWRLAAAAALTYFGIRNLTAAPPPRRSRTPTGWRAWSSRARIAWERSLQDALLDHDGLVTFFNWIYIWGHWPVIITAAVVLYRTRPGSLPPAPQRDLRLRARSASSSSRCSRSRRRASRIRR